MGIVLSKLCTTLPSTLWISLIESIAGFGPTVFSKLPDESRVRVIDALRRIIRYNQTGFDVGWQYTVSSPSIRAAIATLALANVFQPWAAAGWGGKTVEELTEMSRSGAEVELIRRMLDALAGQRLIIKTGAVYSGWRGSWADDLVKDSTIAGHFLGFFEWVNGPMGNLPRFLAKTRFKNPTDSKAGNFQNFYGSGAESYHPPLGDAAIFEKLKSMLAEDKKLDEVFVKDQDVASRLSDMADAKRAPLLPEWAQHIGDFMESHSRYNHRLWTELFPTEIIAKDSKKDRVLVVDIGGGTGHDALYFANLHPEIPDGSVVLQDLPHVIKEAHALEGQKKVVPCEYNYLDPQPIKGARTYYIHVVIHNVDDDRAISVIKNVVNAMEKGYSQMLIHESVIDLKYPHANATSQDLMMMGQFSAQERTRDRWRDVIEKAGLRILDIKQKTGFPDAVIVTEKA